MNVQDGVRKRVEQRDQPIKTHVTGQTSPTSRAWSAPATASIVARRAIESHMMVDA